MSLKGILISNVGSLKLNLAHIFTERNDWLNMKDYEKTLIITI